MSSGLMQASPVPSYVGGKPFIGSGSYPVADPHQTSKVVHVVSSVTLSDVPAVIAAAEAALPGWRAVSEESAPTDRSVSDRRDTQTSVLERRRIFLKAAALLRERTATYAAVEYEETTSSVGVRCPAPAWAKS